MTEAEWLGPGARAAMFGALQDRASDRKLRLYLCAGCRAIWHLLVLPESQKAVDVAERFADREATADELGSAAYWAEADCLPDLPDYFSFAAAWLAYYTAGVIPFRRDPEGRDPFGFSHAALAMFSYMERIPWPDQWLVRDIFGNPFRPVIFSPSWRTSTTLALASQMYESRDFGAMPVLADALQDAGCDSADVLEHCRGPGPHVRGCWVVDSVLGRE